MSEPGPASTPTLAGTLDQLNDGPEYPGDPFCWGYALTAHKAQGSQWNRVLAFDESMCFGADQWRWLYTAITRTIDSVVVVRGAAA